MFSTKKRSLSVLMTIVLMSFLMAIPALAATPIDGVTVTDSDGNASAVDGVVTTTIKSSFTTRKTNTVTIKNELENTATLSFKYNAT